MNCCDTNDFICLLLQIVNSGASLISALPRNKYVTTMMTVETTVMRINQYAVSNIRVSTDR